MSHIADNRPVIVVGMHRSGTTLLARLLQQMGVHMGAPASSPTCEAVALRDSNIRLLRRTGATWFLPAPMRRLLSDPQARQREIAWLRRRMTSYSPLQLPWGWKDPRTTLTLPLWMEVFPQARIVAVVRNGIDVADSLTRREREVYGSPVWNQLRRMAHAVYPWHWSEYKPAPFNGLEAAFRLWDEYQEFWDAAVAGVPVPQKLLMRYEDLLADPLGCLRDVATFLRLPVSELRLAEIACDVNETRRFAFRADARLASFYEQCRRHPAMLRYGYQAPSRADGAPANAPFARRFAA